MSNDLLLDSKIRLWVFLPIVMLTLFVEILRHYLILLFDEKISHKLDEIQKLEMKKRVAMLLKNYKYISKAGFESRKAAFHSDSGFLAATRESPAKRSALQPFSLHNQERVLNMITKHCSNHLPMILAGAWVSYTFSGFICTKVPFPLTFAFKSMLQRNIDLAYLHPSWVSSCSWYFLNVFGLRNFLNMFFEEPGEQDIPDGEPLGGDVSVCFKEDFNNLQMTIHKNGLVK